MSTTFSPWFAAEFNMRMVPRSFVGFPSVYSALAWMERNACGPCTWILNGYPYPQSWDATTEVSK